ncbi:hypothetical protein HDU98_007664, partial [Podochytrium sp. JEL0797]
MTSEETRQVLEAMQQIVDGTRESELMAALRRGDMNAVQMGVIERGRQGNAGVGTCAKRRKIAYNISDLETALEVLLNAEIRVANLENGSETTGSGDKLAEALRK